jgi:hypothetical protein
MTWIRPDTPKPLTTHQGWRLVGNPNTSSVLDCHSWVDLGGGLGLIHHGPPGLVSQLFTTGSDLLKARFVRLGPWLVGTETPQVTLSWRPPVKGGWHLIFIHFDDRSSLGINSDAVYSDHFQAFDEAVAQARSLLGLRPRRKTRARPAPRDA